MIKNLPLLFFIGIFGILLSCSSAPEADLVIHNGNIYTVSGEKAEAVAVTDGKISFVGTAEEAKKMIGEKTREIDLDGKTMTPGLIEGHGHLIGMGMNLLNLDLSGTTSYQQIIDMVAEAAENAKPGQWIQGRGWHQSKWEESTTLVKGFPIHDSLSLVSPNNPVFLKHASGHAALANKKAMEIAGIQSINLEIDPIGKEEFGEIIRDDLGNATGVFNEKTQNLVAKHIPEDDDERIVDAIVLANKECLRHGVTSFHDAGNGDRIIDLYKKTIDEGLLNVRMYVMLAGSDTALISKWYEQGPLMNYGDNGLTVRSIKMYMDGALGSRGAWLIESYSDREAHFGHATTPPEDLYPVAKRALETGFQVCSHAIGDRANREVLNSYQQAFEEQPEAAKDHRFRIEHAQHINGDDIMRFAELGVIPAMQAIHMASDRPWAIDRLGIERILEGAYVWQKLLQSGAVIVNGSDVPVEPIDPLASFYASVSRRTLAGTPEGGYEPDQKMTREQALRSYTLDAAYGAFEEDMKGSIEVGKLADFTIFDKDIMTVEEEEILNTKVVYTIVGGEVLFELE